MAGSYEGKKAIVTGGAGFIGSHLSQALVRAGAHVTIIDSMDPLLGGNGFNIREIRKVAKFVKLDVCEHGKLPPLLKDADFIFHLAGSSSHVLSMENPIFDARANLLSTISLLHAARESCPSARIMFAGTRGQYGRPQYLPVREGHPQNPADINGISKIAAERHGFLHARGGGWFCSLRLTNTYGPRHQMRSPHQGFLGWFVRRALEGKTLEVYGDGKQVRDFNHVSDVVSAFLLCAGKEACNSQAYNLGGQSATVLEIANMVVGIAGSGKVKLAPYGEGHKAVEIGRYVADTGKIRKEAGWGPKMPLSQGLSGMVEFYRKNREHYW